MTLLKDIRHDEGKEAWERPSRLIKDDDDCLLCFLPSISIITSKNLTSKLHFNIPSYYFRRSLASLLLLLMLGKARKIKITFTVITGY